MSRQKGSASLAASLEVQAEAPLDARTVVALKSDLTNALNFPYAYVGMHVFVKEESKLYVLTSADITSLSNWKELGGTLYADTPIGTIIPYGGSEYSVPSGWLLCNGQEVDRTEYADLFAVIGTRFGEGHSSNAFNVPDLREATTKGAGLNRFSSTHYSSRGINVGDFVDDRIRQHPHNVYVRDTGHIHPILFEFGQFVPGAYGFQSPYVSQNANASVVSSNANIQVNSMANFTGTANQTAYSGYATNEVKAVGVNYIIKAKNTPVPADFTDAIDEALDNYAKRIWLVSANNSTISGDCSRIIGGVVTICADIIVPSGNYLVRENAVANVPNDGASNSSYILPCLYRNSASGAEEPSFAIITPSGNLLPYYTKTEYDEIRINTSYSSRI